MKEDVVAANLANLRQSINELKECVNRQNVTPNQTEQHIKVDLDEKIIYNGVAKTFCSCWNDALSVVKKHVWSQRQDTLPFSLWFPKIVELFKQKSRLLEYIYTHICDYNLNRLNIEINTENILRRQDEILAKINELKHPITVIPPNINGRKSYALPPVRYVPLSGRFAVPSVPAAFRLPAVPVRIFHEVSQ